MENDEKQRIVDEIAKRITNDMMKVVQGAAASAGTSCVQTHYTCDPTSFSCSSDFGCQTHFTCKNQFSG
jgi:hypothetical protein